MRGFIGFFYRPGNEDKPGASSHCEFPTVDQQGESDVEGKIDIAELEVWAMNSRPQKNLE